MRPGADLSFSSAHNASSRARKPTGSPTCLRCGTCKKTLSEHHPLRAAVGTRHQTSAQARLGVGGRSITAAWRLDDAGSFADEAHDHVDIGNLEVLGRLRQTIDANRTAGDIDEPPLGLHEEVVVIGNVGVEIGALSTDGDLAQQPRALELVQGVVNGGQGNLFARRHRLLVKDFGGHMTVTIAKQQSRQGHALTRRPQVCPPQQRPYLDPPRSGSPCQTTHSRPPGLSPAGTLGRSHLPKRRTAFMPSSYISICWSSTPRNGGRVVLALGSSGSRSRGEAPRKSPCAPVQRPSFETVIETHIEAPTARAARNAGF